MKGKAGATSRLAGSAISEMRPKWSASKGSVAAVAIAVTTAISRIPCTIRAPRSPVSAPPPMRACTRACNVGASSASQAVAANDS